MGSTQLSSDLRRESSGDEVAGTRRETGKRRLRKRACMQQSVPDGDARGGGRTGVVCVFGRAEGEEDEEGKEEKEEEKKWAWARWSGPIYRFNDFNPTTMNKREKGEQNERLRF